MSELANALGGAAPKHQLVVGADTYEFSLVRGRVKIAFEKALYEKAREALKIDRDDMGEEWYAKKLDETREKYEEGEYAFESPKGQKSLKNHFWAVKFLTIIVSKNGAPLTWEEALSLMSSHGPEVKTLLNTVLYESFPGMVEKPGGEVDPKKAEGE